MAETDLLVNLRDELRRELTTHLLPYWEQHAVDETYGGFIGRILQDGQAVPTADKGGILNARILWTFSAAYRHLQEDRWRGLADRAFKYLVDHFWDAEHEGFFWSLDYQGQPKDDRKHVYAQAFGIYALSEYHLATGDSKSLELAKRLFQCVEKYCADSKYGGYFEAYTRDWKQLDDVRLSEKDLNVPKSMNTHLHLLEAYTTLYRAWPDQVLRQRLVHTVEMLVNNILDTDTGHMRTFFERDWTPQTSGYSFGHDIEAYWLLMDAVIALEDIELFVDVRDIILIVAEKTLEEGQDEDGGIFNEVDDSGRLDTDKHWWPQAEAIVGFLAAYQETGRLDFVKAATDAWTFIQRHIVDREHGEWFTRVDRDGKPYAGEDKVGFWKCPYHSARACIEGINRCEHLLSDEAW